MADYESTGFRIHSSIFEDGELQAMRAEADRLQQKFGTACIHASGKSPTSFGDSLMTHEFKI
jgi:hypothetical protein